MSTPEEFTWERKDVGEHDWDSGFTCRGCRAPWGDAERAQAPCPSVQERRRVGPWEPRTRKRKARGMSRTKSVDVPSVEGMTITTCCHMPAPHHWPWCEHYTGPSTVECPLHGTIPATHRCADSPGDHVCAEVIHPNYDPEDGDQAVSHREWDHTQSNKLHYIACLHVQGEMPGGGTSGYCAECETVWPCRTVHMANGWGEREGCEEEGWCRHEGVTLPMP